MSLLKSSAEEQYQTASGVLAEMDELLSCWEAALRIDVLPSAPGLIGHQTYLILPMYRFGMLHEIGVLTETCETARESGEMHKKNTPARG